MARMVAPGSSSAWYAARFAFAPAWGWTLACSAPKSAVARVARQVLHLVDDLVAPVVAAAGVTLRVLVGQDRARGGQHRGRGEVLGRDQLQRRLLTGRVPGRAGLRPRRRRPALSRSCSCDPSGAHAHRVYRRARRGPGRQPVRCPGHGPRPAHTGCRRRRPGHDARRRPARTGGATRARRADGHGTAAPRPRTATARRAGGVAPSGTALLRRADSLRVVVPLGWHSANPALQVAGRLGFAAGDEPRELMLSAIGGNTPQALMHDACLAISAGGRATSCW